MSARACYDPAMPDTRAIACYLRVSTASQTHDSQREPIEKWLKANAAGRDYDFYIDTGTGRNFKRSEWARLWRGVERGQIGTVVLYSLSRMGRRRTEMFQILDALRKQDVELVCIKEGISGRGQQNWTIDLLVGVMVLLAQVEADIISERTKDGLAAARARGKKLGGEMYDPNAKKGRRKLTPEQESQVEAMLAAKQSEQKIADHFSLSRQVVRTIKQRITSRQGRS